MVNQCGKVKDTDSVSRPWTLTRATWRNKVRCLLFGIIQRFVQKQAQGAKRPATQELIVIEFNIKGWIMGWWSITPAVLASLARQSENPDYCPGAGQMELPIFFHQIKKAGQQVIWRQRPPKVPCTHTHTHTQARGGVLQNLSTGRIGGRDLGVFCLLGICLECWVILLQK